MTSQIDSITSFYFLGIFLLGLAFGSFANVVILRLHSGEKGIVKGRSHCPKCQHLLNFWDLIPFFAWLFLRGRCRYCQKKISIQYPLVEFAMGLLFVLAYALFLARGAGDYLYLLWLLIIFFALAVIFIYDLLYMEIQDEISLPAIGILFVFNLLKIGPAWDDALLGAAIPLAFFGTQYLLSRGKWIGEGDFRLGAMMGLILGWKLTMVALFLSYIFGSLVGIPALILHFKKLSSQMPFGPFLISGTIATLIWGEQLLQWYLGRIGF